MALFSHRAAISGVVLMLSTALPGCPKDRGATGGAPSAGGPSTTSPALASASEWTAVRVDPKTYAETEIGVVAFASHPPFQARFVQGDDALKAIVSETNALDHVMSTGLSGPGTKVTRDEDQYFRIMRGNWLGKVKGITLEVRPKAQAKARRFRAFWNKDGQNVELGLVAMKPSHYLQIVESKEGEAEHLFKALNEVNGRDGLSVDIPPPAGAERGSYGRGVERGTPLFFTLMRDKLLHREHVVLVDESHARPAKLQRVVRSGGGLSQLAWLEVDVDASLAAATTLTAPERVHHEAPAQRLAFVVEDYTGVEYAAGTFAEHVKKRFGALPGFTPSAPRSSFVAGRDLLTMAFRTGSGDAATDHTVVLWPKAYFLERGEHVIDKGLLIHVTAPAQGSGPDAQTALGHAAIVPSIDSLYIDPEWS